MKNQKTNNSPIISVIMPAYNASETIKQAVFSVLAQTYWNFELIVCNDASVDNTTDVLKNISDIRLRVINNETNIGPGLSRDLAICVAKGKWLAFIDADDTWQPERLETLLKVTDLFRKAMIFDDIMECHDTVKGMKPWRCLRGKFKFGCNGIEPKKVTLENYICQNRLIIKPLVPVNFIKKYQIQHSNRIVNEDNEFFLKILIKGLKLIYVPKPMYNYRIRSGSLTSSAENSIMMKEIIKYAIIEARFSPSIQEALSKKLFMIERYENYKPFVRGLKNLQFFKALTIAFQSPWIISEFFSRIGNSISYHSHRILHGGRIRRTI